MRRGSLIFAVALFLLSLLLLKVTWEYSFKSKLFPMITLFIIIILLIVAISQEIIIVLKETKANEREKTEGFSSQYIPVILWLTGTVLILWVLGFMATVLLLPFLYLRWQRESWLLSITIPIGCGLFFYGVFAFALAMPLYPGLIISMIFA